MAAPVLLIFFSAQTHKCSHPAEPATWPAAEPFENWPPLPGVRQTYQRLIPDIPKFIWFYKDRVLTGPDGPFNKDRVLTGPHWPFNKGRVLTGPLFLESCTKAERFIRFA
jgi:hypothetical protein